MIDPTKRFTDKVDNYAQFRPAYPPDCIDFIRTQFGIQPASVIADVGSGTGIFSKQILNFGCTVIGVEPNDNMRKTAELTIPDKRFISVSGTGEATTLMDNSVDLITVAQAFHWMDATAAKIEFKRILRPGGAICLLWNILTPETTFEEKYEMIKEKYGRDYIRIRKSHQPDLAAFFEPKAVHVVKFPHSRLLNAVALNGLIASSSFMPSPADADHDEMTDEINKLFIAHEQNGLVRLHYQTEVHYSQ
jgi:SAM-dependent methyltransferase